MRWRYALGLAASAAAGTLLVRRRFVVVTVEGLSMLPTLAAGDRVLVRRAGLGRLRPGQVVVAQAPDRHWLIKRVAAVPGDPRPAACLPGPSGPGQQWVPAGKFVLLGDNAAVSHDSRQLGYFAGDRLLGVAVRRMSHGGPSGSRDGGLTWPSRR